MTKTAADDHWIVIWEIRLFGLNGHWAWVAATTAMLVPAVAPSVNLPSVSLLRLRTGALDPNPPFVSPGFQ